MSNKLTQKTLLKLAFIALLTPHVALAGSGFQSNQDKDETSSPARAVAAPFATPAGQLSFEMIPSEIIKLILEKLTNPDLQNMRLVEKKLRDLVTQLFTDIKIPGNLPNTKQFDKFFKDLATAPFWKGKKPSKAFVNLFRHAPIKTLNLTSITTINPESLKTLGSILPISLESLDLRDKNVGAEGVKVLAPNLPANLQRLDLDNNKIGDEGAKVLAQGLPATLEQLYLSNNKIGDEGAKALAQNLPATIKRLHLSNNNIGDEGAETLAKKLPATLLGLSLHNNNIGDEGAKALAQNLPATLQRLDLYSNKIGDEGAKALAPNLPATLQRLDLYNNKIGDEGAKALAQGFPAILEYLYLNHNKIGDEGLAALSEAIQGTDLAYLFVSVADGSLFRERFTNLRNRQGKPVTVEFK
ncbi:MAG: hypothetical protein ACRC4G_06145 [Alphaproteobacteria bacterium]